MRVFAVSAAPATKPAAAANIVQEAHGFKLQRQQFVREYDSTVLLYKHEKTGEREGGSLCGGRVVLYCCVLPREIQPVKDLCTKLFKQSRAFGPSVTISGYHAGIAVPSGTCGCNAHRALSSCTCPPAGPPAICIPRAPG